MGRMQDALKKAAEERERKRRTEGGAAAVPRPEPVGFEFRRPEEAVPPRLIERTAVVEPAAAPPPPPRGLSRIDERLVVVHAPSDDRAEEFRKIRANLLSLEPRPRTIMVTSGAPGEGKSLMAANLALTLHEMGGCEVLVVDANLRHPEIAGLFGVPAQPGLADMIGKDGASFDAFIVKSPVSGLSVLPAGSGGVGPARQLQPDVLKGILDRARERFAFVIVDTPATRDYADAVLMSNDVDGVLVVIKVGGGRRDDTKQALTALEGAKARLLGTVVMTGS